jgi:hypothetical protein
MPLEPSPRLLRLWAILKEQWHEKSGYRFLRHCGLL